MTATQHNWKLLVLRALSSGPSRGLLLDCASSP